MIFCMLCIVCLEGICVPEMFLLFLMQASHCEGFNCQLLNCCDFTENITAAADETVTQAEDELDRDILESGKLPHVTFV